MLLFPEKYVLIHTFLNIAFEENTDTYNKNHRCIKQKTIYMNNILLFWKNRVVNIHKQTRIN